MAQHGKASNGIGVGRVRSTAVRFSWPMPTPGNPLRSSTRSGIWPWMPAAFVIPHGCYTWAPPQSWKN